MIGEIFVHHWSGFKFHKECLPDESNLMDEAKKDLGAKPKDVSDAIWLLRLQDRQRKIMTQCFDGDINVGDCCACINRARKAANE